MPEEQQKAVYYERNHRLCAWANHRLMSALHWPKTSDNYKYFCGLLCLTFKYITFISFTNTRSTIYISLILLSLPLSLSFSLSFSVIVRLLLQTNIENEMERSEILINLFFFLINYLCIFVVYDDDDHGDYSRCVHLSVHALILVYCACNTRCSGETARSGWRFCDLAHDQMRVSERVCQFRVFYNNTRIILYRHCCNIIYPSARQVWVDETFFLIWNRIPMRKLVHQIWALCGAFDTNALHSYNGKSNSLMCELTIWLPALAGWVHIAHIETHVASFEHDIGIFCSSALRSSTLTAFRKRQIRV